MKVFKYDISKSQKGEKVCDILIPQGFSSFVYSSDVQAPKHNPNTTTWHIVRKAEDRRGNAIEFPFPVCFCTGQTQAGQETPIWEWYVLLPYKA